MQEEVQSTSKPNNNAAANKLKSSISNSDITSKEVQKSTMGARATDSARVIKFTKELSGSTVILGTIYLFLCLLDSFSHISKTV